MTFMALFTLLPLLLEGGGADLTLGSHTCCCTFNRVEVCAAILEGPVFILNVISRWSCSCSI